MKRSVVVPLIVVACFAALAVFAQQAMPRMTNVEPANGKIGDVLTVNGENLEKAHVSKVYITNGKDDWQVEVTEQAAKALKFKIPVKMQPGRFALMLLTSGKDAKLIEQPVKVTIE